MKSEIRTVMVPKEREFFIADDGTAFERKQDCMDYETETYRKQLDTSEDVVECKEARNYPPFDGQDYIEDHEYRWFKPLNEKGIDLLNKAYMAYCELGYDDVGKWVCSENDTCECWWNYLSVSKAYSDKLLGLLEPEEKEKDNTVIEVCPHCETEVEMKWIVKAHGYKAYCPYCGKRLMLCDECLHPNGEFSDNCDYCSGTDTCRFNKKGD